MSNMLKVVAKQHGLVSLLFFTFIVGVVLSLSSRTLLPWSYYIFSFLVAIVVVISLNAGARANLRFSEKWVLYTSLITLSLVLGNIHNLGSDFKVIGFGDSYWDYVAINLFMEKERICSIREPSYLGSSHASSWPMGPILVMLFSQISGINTLGLFHVLPSAYGIVMLLFIVLLYRVFSKKSSSLRNLPIILLIFAVCPDSIYHRMVCYHRFFSQACYYIALYLLARRYCCQGPPKSSAFLLLLVSALLVMSHFVFSAVYIQFLLYLVLFTVARKIFFGRQQSKGIFLELLVSATAILGYLWNSGYNNYFPTVVHYARAIFSPHLELTTEYVSPEYQIPEALTGPQILSMLRLRDFAIYIPALLGLLVLVKECVSKRNRGIKNTFLLYSIIALAFASVSIFVLGGDFLLAVALIAMPFIVYFSAFSYSFPIGKIHVKKVRIFASLMLVFVTFIAFLSPWSHQYLGSFLYDPSVKPEEVCRYNTAYLSLKPFVDNYILLKNEMVLADRFLLLYVIFQPKDYKLIQQNFDCLGQPSTYLFEMVRLNPTPGLKIPRDVVETKYDRIFDADYNVIRYRGPR